MQSAELSCADPRLGINPSRTKARPRVCSLFLQVVFPSPRASGKRSTVLHRHVKTQPYRSSTLWDAPGFPWGVCCAKLAAVLNELMESVHRGSNMGGTASCFQALVRVRCWELQRDANQMHVHFQAQGVGSPN